MNPPAKREKLFPGPAGIAHPDKNVDSNEDIIPMSTQMEKQQTLLCQRPSTGLQEHLRQHDAFYELDDGPLDKMTIEWIHKKAVHLPTCSKVPFLFAVLETAPGLSDNHNAREKTPCVSLIDSSGTIEGALDAEFVHMYGEILVPGSALALKHAGILRWRNKRGLILTVTSKNVICMAYEVQKDRKKGLSEHLTSTSSASIFDDVKIVQLSNYSPKEIMTQFYDLQDPQLIIKEYKKIANESQDFETK